MQLLLLRSAFVCCSALVGIAAWWINGHIFANYEITQGVGDPIMHFGAPFVSGSSAFLAQRYILGKSDHAQSRLVGLTPANLIALGTLSALINAAGHTLLRIGSGTQGPHADIFASMLAGDLLGALLFLYALKAILWISDRKSAR